MCETQKARCIVWRRASIAALLLLGLLTCPVRTQSSEQDTAIHQALSGTARERRAGMQYLVQNADRGSVALLIQLLRFQPDDADSLIAKLQELTGADPGAQWFEWMLWQQAHPEIVPNPGYIAFLSTMLSRIDPTFRRFIQPDMRHDIRPEEIVWGGVAVDGIPALDNPALITATQASYLNASDQVFGVEINGDARAYPLRIANWHEMINDVVGGVPVSLAYCTLCGSGILFDGRVAGRARPFTFGSSGLLYRSNKLMYDRQTNSLWSQFNGKPVVGQLVGSAITLTVLPVVITSWQQWRSLHPGTQVLSLNTGFARDYGTGIAYHDYFASPALMFPALAGDPRLAVKDRVFGVRLPGGAKAFKLSTLAGGAVINDHVGLAGIVVIGEPGGQGARAYRSDGRPFQRGSTPDQLIEGNTIWHITEVALIGPDGTTLPRLPGHVAYWFAWSGAFEDAQLGADP